MSGIIALQIGTIVGSYAFGVAGIVISFDNDRYKLQLFNEGRTILSVNRGNMLYIVLTNIFREDK